MATPLLQGVLDDYTALSAVLGRQLLGDVDPAGGMVMAGPAGSGTEAVVSPDDRVYPWPSSTPYIARLIPRFAAGAIAVLRAPDDGEIIRVIAGEHTLALVFRSQDGITTTFAGLHGARAPHQPLTVRSGDVIGVPAFVGSDKPPVVYAASTYTIGGVRVPLPLPVVLATISGSPYTKYGTIKQISDPTGREIKDFELKQQLEGTREWVFTEHGLEQMAKISPPPRSSPFRRFLRGLVSVLKTIARIGVAVASVAAPTVSLLPASLSRLMPGWAFFPAFGRFENMSGFELSRVAAYQRFGPEAATSLFPTLRAVADVVTDTVQRGGADFKQSVDESVIRDPTSAEKVLLPFARSLRYRPTTAIELARAPSMRYSFAEMLTLLGASSINSGPDEEDGDP